MGTPAYMAPEQAEGWTEEVALTCDIYSVGSMLYEFLAGRPPYEGKADEVLEKVVAWPPPELPANAHPELAAICRKAMSREISQRYQYARELVTDFQSYLEGRVVSAHESGGWAQFKKWVGRNKGLAAGLATFCFSHSFLLLTLQWLASQKVEAALVQEEDARSKAVLAVERMSLSSALTAGAFHEHSKAAYWFREAAGMAEGEKLKNFHLLKARVSASRASLPWRAFQMEKDVTKGRLDFGPQGRYLFAETRDSPIGFTVFDLANEKMFLSATGESRFLAASSCPLTGRLAVASRKTVGLIEIHGPGKGEQVEVRTPRQEAIRTLQFSPQGDLFVGCHEGYLYKMKERRFSETVFQHGSDTFVQRARFDKTGSRLLTVSRLQNYGEAQLRTFQIAGDGRADFEPFRQWFWPNVLPAQFMGEGDRFIHYTEDNLLQIRASATGENLKSYAFSASDICADGSLVSGHSAVLDLDTGAVVRKEEGYGETRLHPSGDFVSGPWPTLRVYFSQRQGIIQKLGSDRKAVEDVAFSQDGQWLASWHESGLIKIWKFQAPVWSFPVAKNGSLRFSPKGQYVVNAGRALLGEFAPSLKVEIYDAKAGTSEVTLSLTSHLCSGDFSFDERELLTAEEGGAVIFWDCETGVELRRFDNLPSAPRCVRCSPKKKQAMVICADGELVTLSWENNEGGGRSRPSSSACAQVG